MHGEALEKVEGGKLLRIKAEFDDAIRKVMINGDFFGHPEESSSEIEKLINGSDSGFEEGEMGAKFRELVEKRGYELIGINPEAIARVLKNAVRGAR